MAKEIKFTTLGSTVDLTSVAINPDAAPTATPRQGGFVLRNRVNFDNVSSANGKMWTVSDATPTTETTVPFRILEVPERVFVKNVKIMAVKDETHPHFYITGAQSSNLDIKASDFNLMTLSFGAQRNKKPTSSASYAEASHLVDLTTVNAEGVDGYGAVGGDVFGNLKLVGVLSDASYSSIPNIKFVDTFKAVDSSIGSPLEPMQTAKLVQQTANLPAASASGVSANWSVCQQPPGEYFPYGGYVKMQLGPWNTSMASGYSDATGLYSGTTAAYVNLKGVWEFQAECQYVPE